MSGEGTKLEDAQKNHNKSKSKGEPKKEIMTGLLVLITLLLILMVIGMICLATMYYSLYKGFVALKALTEETLPVQNEVINAVTNEMDSFLKIIETIEDKALDCYSTAERVLKDAEANKEFAMTTMRSVRSIKKTLELTNHSEEAIKNFRFEEAEEDPENPRS